MNEGAIFEDSISASLGGYTDESGSLAGYSDTEDEEDEKDHKSDGSESESSSEGEEQKRRTRRLDVNKHHAIEFDDTDDDDDDGDDNTAAVPATTIAIIPHLGTDTQQRADSSENSIPSGSSLRGPVSEFDDADDDSESEAETVDVAQDNNYNNYSYNDARSESAVSDSFSRMIRF